MSYAIRRIRLTFNLGTGNFGESGSSQVVLQGLRVQCHITKTGNVAMGEAQIRVHGLTQEHLNQLTSIYQAPQLLRKNTVTVEAGTDYINNMAVVFTGGITVAQADIANQPDSVLNVIAQAGLIYKVKPLSQTSASASYPKSATIDSILKPLATLMGLDYYNAGVQFSLNTQYLHGSILDQVQQVIQAAGCKWNNGNNNVLAIAPNNSSIQKYFGGKAPVITPDTGMIGYPAYSSLGIMVRTLFNPNINLMGEVQVVSSLPQADYIWIVYGLSYNLESETPNGQWYTEVLGFSAEAASAS